MKTVDDLSDLNIINPEQESFQSEYWPRSIEANIKKLNWNIATIKDLFLSYFALRGEGSIVDCPLLEQTWSELTKKGGFLSIIKNVGDIEHRFVFSKSKREISYLVELLVQILSQVDKIATVFEKKEVEKDLSDLANYLDKIDDFRYLVEKLGQLGHKLEKGFSWEQEQVGNLVRDLSSLESPETIKNQINSLKNQLGKISSNMDRMSVNLVLTKLERDPWIQVLKRLSGFLGAIEQRLGRTLEVSLEKLQKEVSEYVKWKI